MPLAAAGSLPRPPFPSRKTAGYLDGSKKNCPPSKNKALNLDGSPIVGGRASFPEGKHFIEDVQVQFEEPGDLRIVGIIVEMKPSGDFHLLPRRQE